MGRRGRERAAEFSDFARTAMPDLYRTASLLCADRHRAEDLVQETLARVYARWSTTIDNPAAYAQTTLTRTWISQQRRRSTHERPMDRLPEHPAPAPDDALRLTLLDALAGLEPLDRVIVVLRHLDDVPTAEVALRLGMTDVAVRARLMRALRKLRAVLDLPFPDLVTEGTTP